MSSQPPYPSDPHYPPQAGSSYPPSYGSSPSGPVYPPQQPYGPTPVYPQAQYPLAQPGYDMPAAMPMMPMAQPAAPGSGLAIASLVCGIVGVVFAFIPVCGAPLAIILGLVAIVAGVMGRSSVTHHGQATAGLVLGVIALVLSSGILLVTALILNQGAIGVPLAP